MLECEKVLEMLAERCANEKAKTLARELKALTDRESVEMALKETEDAAALWVRFGRPGFDAFEDIEGILGRLRTGARATLKELLEVRRLCGQIAALRTWHSRCEGVRTSLSERFERLTPQPALLAALERSIESEERLSDSASVELGRIRRQIAAAGKKLREKLEKTLRSPALKDALQESIVTIRDGRYVIPVKAEYRGQVAGLIHDTSATGQTYFIEPMAAVEANNDIRLLETREQEETERIIEELCAACKAAAPQLLESYDLCAKLCLCFGKAALGFDQKGVIPSISDDGSVTLKKARHPLIDPQKVVPIDLELGKNYRALIVTGPNTGGKTVALKTLGLLEEMAARGLMIPANSGSEVAVFRRVLADIGDGQSIERSLSTFGAHTLREIEILKAADSETLVLIDEPGSGTDPVEGAALAAATLDCLLQKGALVMVTTHYQELKTYALQTDGVENACCEFDLETLSPTYRLITGSPGKSDAFAISKSLGMPKEVLDRAEGMLSGQSKRFEDAVTELEKARTRAEKRAEELESQLKDAKENAERTRREREEFEAKKAKELEEIRVRARRTADRTSAESAALLEELRALRKEKDAPDFEEKTRAAKSKTAKTLESLYKNTDAAREDYKLPRALKIGDAVRVVSMDKSGSVIALPDAKTVQVQLGIMKVKVPITDIRLEDAPQEPKYKPAAVVKRAVPASERKSRQSLDIRGYTVDDAAVEIDRFLSDAVMSGFESVTIIHGKGTGQLRAGVWEYLGRVKEVKSWRLGAYGEGGDGVTVVTLK